MRTSRHMAARTMPGVVAAVALAMPVAAGTGVIAGLDNDNKDWVVPANKDW
jgi:hypothetical protein